MTQIHIAPKPQRPAAGFFHPASAYETPGAVLADDDLTRAEKRAILAAWASDAFAVEGRPALRRKPGASAVPLDDILAALRVLDAAAPEAEAAALRRALRRQRLEAQRATFPDHPNPRRL